MMRILIAIIILLKICVHITLCANITNQDNLAPEYDETIVELVPPISTGMYMIEAQLSLQVLQVAANAQIIQGNIDSNPDNLFQKFYLISIKENLYYLLGAQNRKIIELAADSITVQERQDFGFSEVDAWRILAGSDGYFVLQHVMSAKYLAVKDPSVAAVYMTSTFAGPETLFKFNRCIVDGVYTIKAKDSSNYMRFRNNIASLQPYSNSSTAPKFFIKASNTSQISIVNYKTNRALTAAQKDNTTQAIIISTFTGRDSQQLYPMVDGTNAFTIQSSSSKYFLTICPPENSTVINQLCLSFDETTTAFELIQDLELPLKRYNERAYLSTHNSYASVEDGYFLYPQHEGGITYQLQHGVRSVNFDIWHLKPDNPPQNILMLPGVSEWLTSLFSEAGIYVFHNLRERGYMPGGTTALPAQRLSPLIQEVVDFLVANPEEIVHIEYEDDGWREDGVPPGPDFDLLVQEYAKVNGLNDLVFNLDNDPLLAVAPTRQWPLISDMIKTNRRLILFPKRNYYSDEQAKQLPQSVGRYINSLPHILEKGVFTAGNDYSCDGFETDMTLFNVSSPLFSIPHMRNFPVSQLHSFHDNEFFTLWSRIQECRKLGQTMINTILLDWFQTPFDEPSLVIRKLNDPSTPDPTRFAQCRSSYIRDLSGATDDIKDFLKGESEQQRTCPPGTDDDLILDQCVLPCPIGYESDLLGFNCLCNCGEGTTELLNTCTRVENSYTRELFSSKSKCESQSGRPCDGFLWTWYPRCNDGFTGILGLCLSSRCPVGTNEVLGICIRNSIPRIRHSPYCKDNTLEYIPRFCMDRCERGFNTVEVLGVPTVGCEAQSCPEGYTACNGRCIKNGGCSLFPDLLTPNPVCNLY